MGKTLVIVESPTKAKAIGKFLGSKYQVKSSMGHVRDLPKSQLGVDVENNFEPKYINIRGKGDILKDLKSAAKKADNVLIASDPDREGEVIAWHLKQILGDEDENCRIEFNEITKDAVKAAVKTPRPINMDMVNAQQARRVLDRLVGYNLSPLLWKKVKKGLSAGRVQSVAVRLISDREDEIKAFTPEEYWTLTADFLSGDKKKSVIESKLTKVNDKKATIPNEEEMNKILSSLDNAKYIVKTITKKDKTRKTAPPFTTSSLQQEAARKLGFTSKKTMQVAQQLYEGVEINGQTVGLITYMRTDSVRVAPVAQEATREYVLEKYGKDYLPAKAPEYKSKGKIQNAHEAIRPTDIRKEPAEIKQFLAPAQYRLYRLIWERFVASQMSSAILATTAVDIEAADCTFRATGSIVKFAGFMQVYLEGRDEKSENDEDELVLLPELKEGQELELDELMPRQQFTQAPPRYTEAMLIKVLEEQGIGRPSTYAPIIDTIITRGYVAREEKRFYLTELGSIVTALLKEYFPDIVNVSFTAQMEGSLDLVEEGEENWREVVGKFYTPFEKSLKEAEEIIGKVELTPEESGEFCEKCGKPMLIKMGKYGKFLACAGFPECRNTKAIIVTVGVKCLKCGGDIIQRKTKGGRIFYGCSNYPECDYISWDLPIEEKCEECGTQLAIKRKANGEEYKVCPNPNCVKNAKKTATKKSSTKATTKVTTKSSAKTTTKTAKASGKTTTKKASSKTTKTTKTTKAKATKKEDK